MAHGVSNTNLNTQRLESIFEKGICGSLALRNYSQDHQPGYDDHESIVAYTNCVLKVEKLAKAVYDPADGIYHISLEYKGDDALVQKVSNKEKVEAKFQELIKKIPKDTEEDMRELYEDRLRVAAFLSELQENDSLLKTLSERSYKVAVLVIEGIELTENEKFVLNETTGGFYFIRRKLVEQDKIKFVLLSQNFDNNEIKEIQKKNPHAAFHFVPSSTQDKVPFGFKEKDGSFTINRDIVVKIEAPDFLPKLTEIFNTHFAKAQKPMFIHTTRL